MRTMKQAFTRWFGISFMLLAMSSVGLAQSSNTQQESVSQQPAATQSGQTEPNTVNQEKTLPTTKGSSATTNASGQPASAELPQSPSPKNAAPSVATQETQGQQPPSQQQNSTQKPIGSAAAEKEKTTGVAASNPAGVAIAPAKQRRGRAFFIKVGAALGAGVAVGTAMALSRSSPSKPPGSH